MNPDTLPTPDGWQVACMDCATALAGPFDHEQAEVVAEMLRTSSSYRPPSALAPVPCCGEGARTLDDELAELLGAASSAEPERPVKVARIDADTEEARRMLAEVERRVSFVGWLAFQGGRSVVLAARSAWAAPVAACCLLGAVVAAAVALARTGVLEALQGGVSASGAVIGRGAPMVLMGMGMFSVVVLAGRATGSARVRRRRRESDDTMRRLMFAKLQQDRRDHGAY